MSDNITPQIPFVWPEPRVSAGVGGYADALPFEVVAQSARSVFGVASSVDSRAVTWIANFLSNRADTQVRMVISVNPACPTTESDLYGLVRLAEHYGERVAFRIFPEASLLDRASNLLCFCRADGDATIALGPTDNLGFGAASPSQANIVSSATGAMLEALRRWFDYLWGVAGALRPEVAATIPRLVIPKGDLEGARLWDMYRTLCFAEIAASDTTVAVEVDPTSGEVLFVDRQSGETSSPTAAIGVPKLDGLAASVAHLFELGALVSVDKLSRIPPLEAPVKPEWFGVESFRQTGMVRAQTSIKVAPFDEATLKKIDRLRRVSGELLPRYSFALADGVRWIPKQAIPLFEEALSAANDDAKKLLGATMGDDIQAFLASQHDRIRSDAQRMYEAYHPGGRIPDGAVANILAELQVRLDKTKADKLIPMVAYSPVLFNPSQNSAWSSPWGQAFALLKGVAEFPREAMANRYFWQGIRTNEDQLINAMNVADDYLVEDYGSRQAISRAEIELDMIKRLEGIAAEPLEKCRVLWTLITSGQEAPLLGLFDRSVPV